MTTIEQQILPLITGPERSVSRQEIEARLEALESQSYDGFTAEERQIAGQILDAIDGENPNRAPNDDTYSGDRVYVESEFTAAYYSLVIEAPEIFRPEKRQYEGISCSTQRGFKAFLRERGFAFPITTTREDNLYTRNVDEIGAEIGNLLQSALGYADDGILVGDRMCESRRAGGGTRVYEPEVAENETSTSVDNSANVYADDANNAADLLGKNLAIILDELGKLDGMIGKAYVLRNELSEAYCLDDDEYNCAFDAYDEHKLAMEAKWQTIDDLWNTYYENHIESEGDLTQFEYDIVEYRRDSTEQYEDELVLDYNKFLDDDSFLMSDLNAVDCEETQPTLAEQMLANAGITMTELFDAIQDTSIHSHQPYKLGVVYGGIMGSCFGCD